MHKREVLLVACSFILLLALAIAVLADPDPSLELKPTSVYESNSINYELTVDNKGGSEAVKTVQATMPEFTFLGISDYIGWDEFFDNAILRWFNGLLANNAKAWFNFDAKAGLVDENKTVNVEVFLEDADGESATQIIPVTILNDYTAPVISNNIPRDGGFLREGNSGQTIGADASDPETGVLNITFSYWNCTNSSALGPSSLVVLSCSGSYCTSTIDVSLYEEGEQMCFSFESYNNALDSSVLSGSVGFDGTPPVVILNSPDDGSYASSSTAFSFTATDNLAPVLNCNFSVDSAVVGEINATNGAETTTSYDFSAVPEGTHAWTVSCSDAVGLENTASPRNIIVDLTAPTVTLVNPVNNSIVGDGVLIEITVTDNYEVGAVGYSASLNTSELPEGVNEIVVNASDKAGNIAYSTFTFIVDRTKPTVTVISPDDNATNDVHISFVVDVTDNLDTSIDCSLNVNGAERENFTANGVYTLSTILPPADYTWDVVCTDDAGNVETSAARVLHLIDISGPDILLNDITKVARNEDYDFVAQVTDPSSVLSVQALFNGEELPLITNEDDYAGAIKTNNSFALGTYNLTINAKDTLNNPSSLVDEFELVQGYLISLNLNPATAAPNQEVVVSGTITKDDGSAIPEAEVIVSVPGNDVTLNLSSGSYSYSFTAPASEGSYDIVISVVSADGFVHRKTAVLVVQAPAAPVYASSWSSGGSGGTSLYCGDGVCTSAAAVNENCKNCPKDCGVCPVKKAAPKPEPKEEFVGGYLVDDDETPIDTELPAKVARDASTVGQATGVFNLGSLTKNALVWLIFILVIAALYYYSSNRHKKKVNWNGYFK